MQTTSNDRSLGWNLLEPAKFLSLTIQKEDIDLIKVVELVGSTQKRYKRLWTFWISQIKKFTFQIMSSNFFNNPSSNTATYKHQDTVLLYFIQAKEKFQKTASKILQSTCQCFLQRYEELTTHDTVNTYVQESVTQGSVLLYHICKILHTNSWIILKGVKRSAAVEKSCISIKKIHSQYKEMKIIKDQLINKLIEPGPFLAVYCVR